MKSLKILAAIMILGALGTPAKAIDICYPGYLSWTSDNFYYCYRWGRFDCRFSCGANRAGFFFSDLPGHPLECGCCCPNSLTDPANGLSSQLNTPVNQ